MANSLSKKISIFPISFDRSKDSPYIYYKRNTNGVKDTDTDKSDLLTYISNNLTISKSIYDNLSSDYQYYYSPISDAKLVEDYPNGRILSEKNITRLISALTDDGHKNFVVHADIPTTGSDANKICNSIEFVIKGRYFALDFTANTALSNDKDLWVGVKFRDTYIINDSANLDEYEQLFAYDRSIDPDTPTNSEDDYDVLAEVDFFDTAPNQGNGWKSSSYNEHLQLLEKLGDGTIRVPIASQFKFTSRSIKNINGGTI